MKLRLIMAVLASALPLAGGSGAAASQDNQDNHPITPVILKEGELARLGNTAEVCLSARMGITVDTQPKQMVPIVACYPSKTGRPKIGTHTNLAAWMRGPSGEIDLVVGIGRWLPPNKAIKDWLALYIDRWWLPQEWGSSSITKEWLIAFPLVVPQSQSGKIKLRVVQKGGGFIPKGVKWTSTGPVCGFSGSAAGCHYQEFVGEKRLLSITFWPPWGPRQVQVGESWLNLNCIYTNDDGSQTPGCPAGRVLYPSP